MKGIPLSNYLCYINLKKLIIICILNYTNFVAVFALEVIRNLCMFFLSAWTFTAAYVSRCPTRSYCNTNPVEVSNFMLTSK